MLAMVVNDDAGRLDARVVWAFIASMLAPTGYCASSRLFNGCKRYLMKATTPCVLAYRYARIRRLVRLGPPR